MPTNDSPDDGPPVPGPVFGPGAPLRLRPWRRQDAAVPAALHRDDALRRWAGAGIDDEASAARWIEAQRRHRQAGDRFAFAVVEAGPAGSGSWATSWCRTSPPTAPPRVSATGPRPRRAAGAWRPER